MSSPSRLRVLTSAVLLLAVVVTSLVMLLSAYHSYENAPSPFSPVHLPEVTATAPVSGRVVVMLSDGLRADLAAEMRNVASLAQRPDASFHIARTEIPSLSEPGWTAIMSGAGPRVSGVRTNAYSGSPVPVETLFQTAARARIPTAVAGAATEWEELFRGQPNEVYVSPFPYDKGAAGDFDSDPLVARALGGPAKLMVLYFPAVDDASHYHGPFSDEGVAAMLGFDKRVGEVARSLDLSRDTLIVTSDHGHVDVGGHGGSEELARGSTLLMVGKGIEKSGPAIVSQLDVAPTIAVLLGIGRPRDAEGMPLLDSISADSALKSQAHAIHDRALRKRLGADYQVISGEEAPDASVEVLREKIESASWERGVSESLARLPVGVVVVALLGLIVHLAGGLTSKSVGAAFICLGLVAIAVWSSGFTWSMSYFNVSGDESGLLLAAVGATMAGMAVAGLIVGNKTTTGAWRQAVLVSAIVVFVCGVSASALMVYYGPSTGWRMPDLRLSWVMFIIPAIVAIAAVSAIPIAAGTALLAHKVTAKSGTESAKSLSSPSVSAMLDAPEKGGGPVQDGSSSGTPEVPDR